MTQLSRKKVYQLIENQPIIFLDSIMSNCPNYNQALSLSIYETPLKKHAQNRRLLLTNDESYGKSNQKSILSNNLSSIPNHMSMNIFKKKKHTRTIKKSNLKLLIQQSFKLNQMKTKADSSSDAFKQSYKNELDQVYVILGRIENIHEDRKYYNIFCQDETKKEFRLYFLKNIANQNSAIKTKKSEIKKRITNLDSLEFQANQRQGTPYFKFFVIFREIPIFDNDKEEVLNSEDKSLETDPEQSAERKFCKPKLKTTQFRVYLEHFEKVEDWNYVTFHNLQIVLQVMEREKMMAEKMQIFQDDI